MCVLCTVAVAVIFVVPYRCRVLIIRWCYYCFDHCRRWGNYSTEEGEEEEEERWDGACGLLFHARMSIFNYQNVKTDTNKSHPSNIWTGRFTVGPCHQIGVWLIFYQTNLFKNMLMYRYTSIWWPLIYMNLTRSIAIKFHQNSRIEIIKCNKPGNGSIGTLFPG